MASPNFSDSVEPQPKRRKVRKGTHTCWECKRRKVRCTFASDGDDTCVGCAKRCLRCVSQEFPEETTTPAAKSRLVGDRIVRVEEMIRQLAEQTAAASAGAGGGGTAAAAGPDTGRPTATATAGHSSAGGPCPSAVCPATGMATPSPSETPVSSASSYCDVVPGPAANPAEPPPASAPASSASAVPPPARRDAPGVSAMLPGVTHEQLSEALLAVFPSRRDMDMIAEHTTQAYNHVQLGFRSHRDVRSRGFWPTRGLCIHHSPQTHPVLVARLMLVIAVVLQCSDPEAYRKLQQLSEPTRDIITRLGDTAISLVTRNDALLDTLEGIECIMLEGMYHANGGQLRRSWLTWRRGLSLAQLMRIPHQSPGQAATTHIAAPSASLLQPFHLDPQFLWFRLLSTERFMCLLLGLPQTMINAPLPPTDALGNDTPLGQLEEQLAGITSFILDRNERGPRPDDYANTLKIDKDMQDLAAALPSRWWLPPNLSSVPSGELSLWETMRLTYQSFYYNLLHQLHLPYMLHPSSVTSSSSSSFSGSTPPSSQATVSSAASAASAADDDAIQQRNREYSRIVCVGASREVLHRYIALRTYNHVAGCCRFAEFFALTAALTLILVHIDGHRNRHNPPAGPGHPGMAAAAALVMPDNLLAHQRLSDRAMTEEALESMERVGKLNEDVISETSVDLLRQLLAIEAEAARGGAIGNIGASSGGDTSGGMRISVPYVGYITIARNGAITKESHVQPPAHVPRSFSLPSSPRAVRSSVEARGVDAAGKAPGRAASTAAAVHAALTRPSSPLGPAAGVCEPPEPAMPTGESEVAVRTHYDFALMPRMEQFVNFAGLMGQDLSSGASLDKSQPSSAHANTNSGSHTLQQHPSAGPSPPGAGLSLIPHTTIPHDVLEDAATAACPADNYIPLPTQSLYPGPAAGPDQWAFQGVDMAFFDNLMRETTIEPGREISKPWM